MLRIILIVALLLVNAPSFCQLQPGSYRAIDRNTAPTRVDSLIRVDNSTLTIHPERTFTYHHRRSITYLLWFDTNGQWESHNDTLILIDSVSSHKMPIRSYSWKQSEKTFIRVLDEAFKPLKQIKVAYTFPASEDTIIGYTDTLGKIVFKDPRSKRRARKYSRMPYSEDRVHYTVYEQQGEEGIYTKNGSVNIGMEGFCVIAKDLGRIDAIRKSFFRIKGKELEFLHVRYDKFDFYPIFNLMQDFSM